VPLHSQELASVIGDKEASSYKKQADAIKASMQQNMYNKTLRTFTDGYAITHSAWHSTAFAACVSVAGIIGHVCVSVALTAVS
jgi:GH15 family glucan-1,4-alpha-glucosidase